MKNLKLKEKYTLEEIEDEWRYLLDCIGILGDTVIEASELKTKIRIKNTDKYFYETPDHDLRGYRGVLGYHLYDLAPICDFIMYSKMVLYEYNTMKYGYSKDWNELTVGESEC